MFKRNMQRDPNRRPANGRPPGPGAALCALGAFVVKGLKSVLLFNPWPNKKF
jgi:hypothetical protein